MPHGPHELDDLSGRGLDEGVEHVAHQFVDESVDPPLEPRGIGARRFSRRGLAALEKRGLPCRVISAHVQPKRNARAMEKTYIVATRPSPRGGSRTPNSGFGKKARATGRVVVPRHVYLMALKWTTYHWPRHEMSDLTSNACSVPSTS